MAVALQRNTELGAAEAGARATAARVPQARAALLPLVTATAGLSAERYVEASDGTSYSGNTSTVSGKIDFTQPLFDGFRGRNALVAAHASDRAATQAVQALKQAVLLGAVTAYADVLRDRGILLLRTQSRDALTVQREAARGKYAIGEATVTDVAQAETQLALATALQHTAQADLALSEANFLQTVGREPGALALASLPDLSTAPTLDAALAQGLGTHPSVLAAHSAAMAAKAQVAVAEGYGMPSLDLTASVAGTRSGEFDGLPGVGSSTSPTAEASVGLQLTVPLYEGGRRRAQVAEARETYRQRLIEADRSREQVRTAIVAAWNQRNSASANVVGLRERVRAATVALQGVKVEEDVGQRTVLDLLNAQDVLATSQVALLQAEHDLIVSSYGLLAAMGRLDPAG